MTTPNFLEVYRGLISTSSISSTDPKWDEGNTNVIAKLAQWLKDLDFTVEIDRGCSRKTQFNCKKRAR